MSKPTALFYDFFQTLRSRGWELGWEQYELFMRGFILSKFETKQQLLNFCKTVWLFRPELREEFEQLFEHYYANVPAQYLAKKKESEQSNNVTPSTEILQPPPSITIPTGQPDPMPTTQTSQEIGATAEVNPEIMEVSLNIDSGSGNTIDIGTAKLPSAKDVTFLFSEQKHLPFTVRKASQTVRKLRVPTKKSLTTALDVPALVQQVAKEGMVSRLIYQRKNVGVQQVIWLSDHGGSMLPFEPWEKQLLDIIKNTPNIRQTEQYFFHDYPSQEGDDFKLFTNRAHSEIKTLSSILKASNKHTAVIIFSDGGAARRRFDAERLQVFLPLITTLKNTTQRLVWLNPVRQTQGTMADYLSFLVSVRYPNNDDLKRLILAL